MEEKFIHQWVFVVIPVDVDGEPIHSAPFLCGFCKGCRQAFTKRLEYQFEWNTIMDDTLIYTDTGLPKWGCIGPEASA